MRAVCATGTTFLSQYSRIWSNYVPVAATDKCLLLSSIPSSVLSHDYKVCSLVKRSSLLSAAVSPKEDRTLGHISLPGALTLNLLQTAPSASSVLKTLLQAD
jgi:hypothetical protein